MRNVSVLLFRDSLNMLIVDGRSTETFASSCIMRKINGYVMRWSSGYHACFVLGILRVKISFPKPDNLLTCFP
jgi:hypothetical protein